MSTDIQLHIEGMTCTSCAAAVEKALSKVPQVDVAQVNFAGKKALLHTQDDTAEIREQLQRAVRDAGYSVVDPAEKREQAAEHIRGERRRLIWAWVLTAPLMVFMLLQMVWGINVLPGITGEIIRLAVSAVVIFVIGYPVIRSTVQSFRNLVFTMDSLIGIGAVAAFSTGVLRLSGIEIGDFTSIGAMIVAINYIGTYIKVKATGRASSAIQQLLELGAKEATRVTSDGDEEVVAVTDLVAGDIVRVRPGEKVPADGTIVRGTTSIDESIVSGESVPADKEPGSAVVGATINQMGAIDVRVEHTGEDTFLAQIIELVEAAQSSRVPVQELADRVTAVFVPAILVLSVATFGVWMVITGGTDVSAALSAAIATLVIACPCALGLATPTALMVGMGYGAERGVLIRNGEAIQTARELDTVVFDKTGTLTYGRPEVRASCGIDGAEATGDAVAMTLAIEKESEHPLARALTSYLAERTTDTAAGAPASALAWTPTGTRAVPGHGITAELHRDGAAPAHVAVGSVRWLRESGAHPDAAQEATIQAWRADGMTIVGTAVLPDEAGGAASPAPRILALYALADAIKADAREAVAALHRLGLRTAMLTGDAESAAQAIARSAGIDDVFAELLPEQKIDAVRTLQERGHKVAMVGDGINDAPALKQSNVGIAIGTGTDIAIESADITLMSSSLAMIPRAVEISRRTFRKIRTNLFWAFFYNLVAIPLAVMGLLHPVIAEVAMAFSSITVVGNSLHLRRILRREIGATQTAPTATESPAQSVTATNQTLTKPTEGDTQMGIFGSKQQVSYHIADMNCGHCEAKVTAALQELSGVKKVKATADDKTVRIEFTGDTAPDLATVNSVLEPAGYPATPA